MYQEPSLDDHPFSNAMRELPGWKEVKSRDVHSAWMYGDSQHGVMLLPYSDTEYKIWGHGMFKQISWQYDTAWKAMLFAEYLCGVAEDQDKKALDEWAEKQGAKNSD